MKKAIQSVKIPASCSPFVNTNLKPAGRDPESGNERFWFSCWNHASGSVGALVCADGKNKVFRFDPQLGEHGFYSAQYGGNEDMWLVGRLNVIVHLDLNTGERKHYPTGMPADLCGGSLTFDEASGKLFCWTYCQGDYKRKGFVFDTNTCEIVKRYDELPMTCNTTRFFLKMENGKYIYPANTPDIELYTWDPENDEVEVVYRDRIPNHNHIMSIVMRNDGCIYIPYRGWFNPETRMICDDERAPFEMLWIAVKGDLVYGISETSDAATLNVWNRKDGQITYLHTIPNGFRHACRMMEDGRFLIVNMYCYMSVFDPENKSVCTAKKLPMESVGFLDCIYRVDENTLLATPFITQRFLKIDLETGNGYDMGRANDGPGEVLQTTMLDGKVYMASYTKGQISMWDPKNPLGYPENPLVVAEPGHCAMRPVSICKNDRIIFCSNSREYGHTGGVLVAYDTRTGTHRSVVSPVGERILHTMFWDDGGFLLAGSTCEADCRCVPPVESICKIVKIDPVSLLPVEEWNAPDATYFVGILGRLQNGKYLVSCENECAHCHELSLDGEKWTRLFVLDAKNMSVVELPSDNKMLYTVRNVIWTKRDGYFILRRDNLFSLASFDNAFEIIEDIAEIKNCTNIHVQDDLLYLADKETINIYKLSI